MFLKAYMEVQPYTVIIKIFKSGGLVNYTFFSLK